MAKKLFVERFVRKETATMEVPEASKKGFPKLNNPNSKDPSKLEPLP